MRFQHIEFEYHVGTRGWYGEDGDLEAGATGIGKESLMLLVQARWPGDKKATCVLSGFADPIPVNAIDEAIEVFFSLSPGEYYPTKFTFDSFDAYAFPGSAMDGWLLGGPLTVVEEPRWWPIVELDVDTLWDLFLDELKSGGAKRGSSPDFRAYLVAIIQAVAPNVMPQIRQRLDQGIHSLDFLGGSQSRCSQTYDSTERLWVRLLTGAGLISSKDIQYILGISRGTLCRYARELRSLDPGKPVLASYSIPDVRRLVLRPLLKGRESFKLRDKIRDMSSKLGIYPIDLADLL